MLRLVERAERPIVRALIATLFETGCRVSEALTLRPDQFDVEDDWVIVYGVQVLKKGNVDPRERIRPIPIPMDEPLTPYMINWVETCESERLFPRSRTWAYKQIRKTDPDWWPHRLRSERACQLVVKYGYRVPDLMKWFHWSDTKVPTTYVQLDVEDLKDRIRSARDSKLRMTIKHGV